MPGTQAQNLKDNLNIDAQITHNLAHLLYSNGNISCFEHPSCDLRQDRHILAQITRGMSKHFFNLIYLFIFLTFFLLTFFILYTGLQIKLKVWSPLVHLLLSFIDDYTCKYVITYNTSHKT